MNNEFKNYYKILGVTQDATDYSIRLAAQREMEYANPRQRDLIREAAYVLLNYESRKKYDEIYNENVNEVDRARQNAKTQDDFLSVSSIEVPNHIDESNSLGTDETSIEKTEEPAAPLAPEESEKEKTEEPAAPSAPEESEEEKTEEPAAPSALEESEEVEIDLDTLKSDKEIKKANRKRITKNALIIAGSTILLGPIGGIVSSVILGKKGKFKLQKTSVKGKIKEIHTDETKIIDEYNKKLETKIDTLLNSPLTDNQSRYKLEIAKLKYQNQIELLEKRIEFKKNQISEFGAKAYNKLYVLSLEMRYNASIKFLEIRKKKAEAKLNALNNYHPNMAKTDKLTDIYENIEDVKEELKDTNLSYRQKNKKTIELKNLNSKKINTINKMALKKNGISRRQVAVARFNSIKDKVLGLFSREESQQEDIVSRTR